MKSTFIIALFFGLVPLFGCRSRKELTASDFGRHADSVAALRSIAAHEIVTESETTTIVMRPDTLGRLVEVARDVVRTVTRTAENAMRGDTAVFVADTKRHSTETIKTQETLQGEATRRPAAFLYGMWAAFTLLAFGLLLYLAKTWTSRH